MSRLNKREREVIRAAMLLPALARARQEAMNRKGIRIESNVVGGPQSSATSNSDNQSGLVKYHDVNSNKRLIIVYSSGWNETIYRDTTTGKEYLSVDGAGTCPMQ
jgi:hypothetical protein